MRFAAARKICVATGLYRPARCLYRLLHSAESIRFKRDSIFYGKLLERDSLCFDIGANIGRQTEALLKAGMRVVAFEPQPECMAELKAQCGKYGNKLKTYLGVVGAEIGEALLYRQEDRVLSTLCADWYPGTRTTNQVTMVTLDHAISQYGRPSYCKIDVEGWELDVLEGLTEPIHLLSFEYHLKDVEIEKTLACLDRLSQLGEISINITAAECLSFSLPEWLPLEKFLKLFPHNYLSRYEFRYGDIFVRFA